LFPHVRSLGSETDIEEERRLCYVGMTRARERLYLAHAWSRTVFGKTGQAKPSRFLDEIPEHLVDRPVKEVSTFSFGQTVSRPARPEPRPDRLAAVYPGEVVRHATWGEGIVVEVEGSDDNAVATVTFSDVGTKRLLLSYTPLQLNREGEGF
jgi:DNA helicase II / ATP-dependent DNA helicase PcrA